MGRRRSLNVELNSGHDNIVRGPGASELVKHVSGREPAYIALRRGFSCQEHIARDVIALAERLGYDIVITGPRGGGDDR